MADRRPLDAIEKAEFIFMVAAARNAAGGTAESAGVPNTPTVTVVDVTPLTPGVTYEFWLAGENSRGKGPESNHVSFTA